MTPPDSALGRASLTLTKRVELLERDREQQSRIITEMVESVGKGFSDEQLSQISKVFREALADAGLRLDGTEQQFEAREDFRFLRRFRLSWDGASKKVGGAILGGAIIIVGVILVSGFWAWINSGGRGP
ncbi:hypothetical protein [Pelagibacterium lacus]|uniref:Uncharacterized protein n=1 Tax=Pelagibacterium lacus TaxID=2282655 RepID=A0A369W814_9HYPH|nr:hypothetical protein [Pelagibacterium lacus]RDE10109.1 hypothetical protein DVH29_01560 [Pelagibacterium lacus]